MVTITNNKQECLILTVLRGSHGKTTRWVTIRRREGIAPFPPATTTTTRNPRGHRTPRHAFWGPLSPHYSSLNLSFCPHLLYYLLPVSHYGGSPQDPLSSNSRGIHRGSSGDPQAIHIHRGSSGNPQGTFRGSTGDPQEIHRRSTGDPQGILRGSSMV